MDIRGARGVPPVYEPVTSLMPGVPGLLPKLVRRGVSPSAKYRYHQYGTSETCIVRQQTIRLWVAKTFSKVGKASETDGK
jgi:hypothetical protein